MATLWNRYGNAYKKALNDFVPVWRMQFGAAFGMIIQ